MALLIYRRKLQKRMRTMIVLEKREGRKSHLEFNALPPITQVCQKKYMDGGIGHCPPVLRA
jgi:hypothetical protein